MTCLYYSRKDASAVPKLPTYIYIYILSEWEDKLKRLLRSGNRGHNGQKFCDCHVISSSGSSNSP